MRRGAGVVAASAVLACVVAMAPTAVAQRKTVWSGIYTAAQAAQGKRDYDLHCAGCHGTELGGLEGPPLAGGDFLRNWIEDDLHNLVDKVQTRMPGDAPGSLSLKESTDIVSYMLEANQFPAGTTELPADLKALESIRIEAREGPGPVPNFSLVSVIGCLAQGTDAQWSVTHATEPLRTRESAPTLRAADAPIPVLGTQTFRLLDVVSAKPDASRGRRVEVKGLLMRQPTGPALNVTSIQSVGPPCP